MGKYIKIAVYSTIAITIIAYSYLSSIVNKLVSEEQLASYNYNYYDYRSTEINELSYHYLDSLGGQKTIWVWSKNYSYPEVLNWCIKWGLRSDDGLDGRFEWEPNYSKVLKSWGLKKDTTLLNSLARVDSNAHAIPFWEKWKLEWPKEIELKSYFEICQKAKNNTEAFAILSEKIKSHLPQSMEILEGRLKSAKIDASLLLDEQKGKVLIEAKGWLNQKALRLLLESKGKMSIKPLILRGNLVNDIYLYDRALEELERTNKITITSISDLEEIRQLAPGPILRELYIQDKKYTASPFILSSYNHGQLRMQEQVLEYLTDSLARNYFPTTTFGWTLELNDNRYAADYPQLYALNATELNINTHTQRQLVQKGSDGFYELYFQFNEDYMEKWELMTERYLYNQLAFVLDDRVIQAPLIQQSIVDGKALLYGGFSRATATTFAALINSPTLKYEGKLNPVKWGYPANLKEMDRTPILFVAMTIAFLLTFLILLILLTPKIYAAIKRP